MLVEPGLLSAGVSLACDVMATAVVATAALTAPWRVWLDDHERQWVWLASLALLVAIWSMKAGITPGLSVRFLLVTALTLMHGWQLAVVGAVLVLGVLDFTGQAAWGSFGANLLCMAIVPALFTAWLHELVHARLPHNYFIYFFVTVFLGAALAYNLAGIVRIGLLAMSGSLEAAHAGPEYFAILPLMSFGEAFVNGMVMAMVVVYRPKWVMSFDDRLYLRKRPGTG
ncbi:MAG: energy-coupling factor ABC transporter permease [Steroidobacteraceae bacterium]